MEPSNDVSTNRFWNQAVGSSWKDSEAHNRGSLLCYEQKLRRNLNCEKAARQKQMKTVTEVGSSVSRGGKLSNTVAFSNQTSRIRAARPV